MGQYGDITTQCFEFSPHIVSLDIPHGRFFDKVSLTMVIEFESDDDARARFKCRRFFSFKPDTRPGNIVDRDGETFGFALVTLVKKASLGVEITSLEFSSFQNDIEGISALAGRIKISDV